MTTATPIVPSEIVEEFAKIKCPVNAFHAVRCSMFVDVSHVVPGASTYVAFCNDCKKIGTDPILKSYFL